MSHHASGADDAAITDGDTADDGYITAEPAVIADPNWLSVFQVIHLSPVIHLGIPFFVVQGMHRSQERNIRSEEHIVADGDGTNIHNGEIIIGKEIFAGMDVNAIVNLKGTLYERAFSQIRDQCLKQFPASFSRWCHLIFGRFIKSSIQGVCVKKTAVLSGQKPAIDQSFVRGIVHGT